MEAAVLVLSRKVNDSIVLPELNVSIEILQVKGKAIRVGIDAPIEIKVVRGEIDSLDEPSKDIAQTFSLTGDDEHEIRNKLNALNIAVALSKKLIERGEFNQAASRLYQAFERIQDPGTSEQAPNFSALLVEDVDNEREMLAGFLRLHGYRVDTVPDGLSALDYLESNPSPDFIMMDIRMPRMNGAELIRRIRENPSFDPIKLFAISGESPGQAEVDLSKNRVSRWFQKPLQPADLVSEINREFTGYEPTCN